MVVGHMERLAGWRWELHNRKLSRNTPNLLNAFEVDHKKHRQSQKDFPLADSNNWPRHTGKSEFTSDALYH
jgi:hypothetical protein